MTDDHGLLPDYAEGSFDPKIVPVLRCGVFHNDMGVGETDDTLEPFVIMGFKGYLSTDHSDVVYHVLIAADGFEAFVDDLLALRQDLRTYMKRPPDG